VTTAKRIIRHIKISSLLLLLAAAAIAQDRKVPEALETPLKQEILTLFTNEISGQVIFNNEVRLAGAPWIRDREEFTGTFYEAEEIHRLVRSYGIETTRLERYPRDRKFDYPFEGEFWIVEPEPRLIARLDADAALVAGGTQTADITGELIYIPPMNEDQLKKMTEMGLQERYRGKLALMWNHVRGDAAKALDAAGVQGVISFRSRDRYLDSNQVVYSSGSYGQEKSLKVGLSISWRQWSELLEDVQTGKKIVVRAKTRVEKFQDKFETVYSWIPGTEPDASGVVFTAHLFEGYTKRGANDNMSGCVVQLEILRALTKLIAAGDLPRPRRTIHFVWPNEISGTYELIKQKSGFADTVSININMDMVGEGLRKNNSLFTMSECPSHLPSYLDGLAESIMNYVWRTNDIVYLPNAPRGRPGGQYFPIPMMEKNGSIDAFRFYIHQATGGSDHICFNNPSVAVPAIEFFTWPDQWYHADTDTPDKSDPTQMKRVAFIGAATAWVAANCTDEMLPGLLDAVSDFGYARVAEREIPRAMAHIEKAKSDTMSAELTRALNLVQFGSKRELGALGSIEDIYTGSQNASSALDNRISQWKIYRKGLTAQVLGYAEVRAAQLGISIPKPLTAAKTRGKYDDLVVGIHPDVKGREFSLNSNEKYRKYMEENKEALKDLGITPQQARTILNYVNGKRSVAEIRNDVAAEMDQDVPIQGVAGYLELLKSFEWVAY